MVRYLTVLLFLILCSQVSGQHIPSIGVPHVQSFSKSQYKAGNQNWSLDQDKDGIVYAANSNGLLTFDGTNWELYPLPRKEGVRSVRIAANGYIYVGGKEEFGYFERQQNKLKYHSLTHLLPTEMLQSDEIWKILFVDKAVLFQSFSKFYRYNDGKISMHYGDGEPFLFAHQANDRTWIEKIPSGLHLWQNDKFYPLTPALNNVLTMLSFDGETLVGTAKNGLFILKENGTVEPWSLNNTVNQLLKESQINNGIRIDEQTFALGTIKNGIFILNREGKLLQHIHKRNGLQNNTILSLLLDKQGNIWAGLDNGIDRIEVNSPFYYHKDIFGELGTVYAIKVFQDKIYLGTNQGLFVSPWPPHAVDHELRFQFVPHSQGQVWSLDILNNQLICGHNDGTFIVKGTAIERISDWTGGWQNIQLQPQSSFFIQGNYTGLALFEDNRGWKLKQKFDFPKETVLSLYPRDNNTFWAIFNSSIKLMEFNPSNAEINELNSFLFDTDFPRIQRINPIDLQGNTIFTTDKGLFVYDNVLGKFSPYTELNTALGSFVHATRTKSTSSNSYLFANQGRFAQIDFQNNNFHVDSSTFNALQDMIMRNYEQVEAIDNKLLFALDNGFAVYDSQFKGTVTIQKPLIKGLLDLSSLSTDTLFYLDTTKPISFKQNNIRVSFSSPWYTSTPLKYQYILDGYQKEWSLPTEVPYIDFTNLSWGTYRFKVRAIATDGQISDISEVRFTIQAPLYLRWPAFIGYMILIVLLTIIIRQRVIEKIKQDKLQLRHKLRLRQEELLRRETEQNEKKLMALKNEQLQQELELKNRELANAAANIVYKNELLNNLNQEFHHVRDKEGNPLSINQLQKVKKLIDNARSDERDWDIFERSFNESHENFFKKLKHDYPNLSPNDLKLCAYLRLNMSSKDIASLLNITTRGVEIRRYRLRKKFNLPTEKNLTEFLLEQ